MSKVIVPTVGRKIWLWWSGADRLSYEQQLADGDNHPTVQPLDASICRTFNDHLISVTAASGGFAPVLYTSVQLIQDGEPYDLHTGLHCQWMPFQVGQAKAAQSPVPPTLTLEQEIQAKGLTAPRVTPARIEEVIAEELYFTAADGVRYLGADVAVSSPANLLTLCVLVLRNGFTVVGTSACASPENFDAAVGRRAARNNAVQQLWPLEGYLLKQRLHVGEMFDLTAKLKAAHEPAIVHADGSVTVG